MFRHDFAESFVIEIILALHELHLPLRELLSISSGGPRSLCQQVNQEKSRQSSYRSRSCLTADAGFCSFHVMHSAFRKGLEAYGSGCEELALDLYYFFKISSARREDFGQFQEDLGLEEIFLRYVECRWLSLFDALR